MNREQFIRELAGANSSVDEQHVHEILRDSIDVNLCDGNPRGHQNLIIVTEELAELTHEVTKELRGKVIIIHYWKSWQMRYFASIT